MPHRDVNTWNSLILAYDYAHSPEKAYHHFLKMMEGGTRLNGFTFTGIMNAVLKMKFNALVPQLHALVVRLGLTCDSYLVAALMRGYICLGDRRGFSRVFDEVEYVKNVEVYTMLILGYIEFGLIVEAKRVFDLMPTRSAHTWSIMIKGLMDNRMVIEARQVFNSLPTKDVISWTTMITGYTKCGKFVEALELFVEMMRSGMCRPNVYTLSNVLHACLRCSSLAMGKQFHACLLKLGILSELASGNSLIDMYTKAGDIDAAFCVFESMTAKNLVSWNSINVIRYV